jgi:hypothetical protein
MPDFTLTSPNGRKVHIEVFHRFHHGQLKARIAFLTSNPESSIVMGISTKLLQDTGIRTDLEKAQKAGIRHFEFRDFPTAKSAIPAIKSISPI